ncbi:PulJ/GspJ family protein [Ectothiorhodospira lacustris]|uniref:PulJ/GspJ family protein n=1 Tax=Ectothiorhodospira lacustris TaxID=2899127 RepID=UPI001EE8A5FC|nr:type II secretion system protein [Ectothiorhodospira lacustris]MCG5500814.1 type II secretion system GspH family protein [Ectothiorhodospira lacustris]
MHPHSDTGHRYRSRHRQGGLTLLEMLVTLVLFATVSTLLWQALGTVARLEERLGESRLFAAQQALRAQWVSQALSGLMSGARQDPLRPEGDARQLRAYSTHPPWPGSSGPEAMRLWLESDGDGGTRLLAQPVHQPERIWPVWHWQGSGAFRYLDTDGRWHDQWPPDSGDHPALPRAIHLQGPPGGGLLAAVPAGDNPMLRRMDLEAY